MWSDSFLYFCAQYDENWPFQITRCVHIKVSDNFGLLCSCKGCGIAAGLGFPQLHHILFELSLVSIFQERSRAFRALLGKIQEGDEGDGLPGPHCRIGQRIVTAEIKFQKLTMLFVRFLPALACCGGIYALLDGHAATILSGDNLDSVIRARHSFVGLGLILILPDHSIESAILVCPLDMHFQPEALDRLHVHVLKNRGAFGQ